MHIDRRDFLKATGAAGATLSLGGAEWGCARDAASPIDPFERELALLALDEARAAGGDYADVRVPVRWESPRLG